MTSFSNSLSFGFYNLKFTFPTPRFSERFFSMSGHDAITASGVSAAPIKSSAGSSGIRLTSSLVRLAPGESIDRQPIDEDNHTTCERIREAIVADKSLSLYAQNIEISAGPRGVTLDGTVKSQEEKDRVETGVAMVVKVGKVFNKLIVKSSQKASQAKSSQFQESNEEPNTEQEYSRIRRLWGIRERPACRNLPGRSPEKK